MIVLFTDFGLDGPYAGQMKAVPHQMGPGITVIRTLADVPAGNRRPPVRHPARDRLLNEGGVVTTLKCMRATRSRTRARTEQNGKNAADVHAIHPGASVFDARKLMAEQRRQQLVDRCERQEATKKDSPNSSGRHLSGSFASRKLGSVLLNDRLLAAFNWRRSGESRSRGCCKALPPREGLGLGAAPPYASQGRCHPR